MMSGGLGPTLPADPETQVICDEVKNQLEGEVGRNFAEYNAILFRSQVVAGTVLFIKVHVGHADYIHIRIFIPLPGPGKTSLGGYQLHKTKDDPIKYFNNN
uniref:Cystatin B n=1 Tax=Perinereis aibuhitensis TaxID=126650 RepID=B8Y627_PERAI|nr:cystatin B [Perinereis aibuhitensis]